MYTPREDSFLLQDSLKKILRKENNKKIKILDLGTGSGIQAETCINLGFENIIASDIDTESVNSVKKKKINAIKSNLFSNLKGKFDLIIFNPPYLPQDELDKEKDTSGGKRGDETIIKFLTHAPIHLTDGGKIIILLSSLTPRQKIDKILKNYKVMKLSEKKIFFENLEVFELS